jgi:hypothetical protein
MFLTRPGPWPPGFEPGGSLALRAADRGSRTHAVTPHSGGPPELRQGAAGGGTVTGV